MKRYFRSPGSLDGWALCVVYAALAWRLAVREIYHRGSGEVYGLTLVGTTLCLSLVVVRVANRYLPVPMRPMASRLALLFAIFFALVELDVLDILGGTFKLYGGLRFAALGAAAVAALLLARRLPRDTWSRLRLATIAATGLMVLSPMAFVWWRAPNVIWPPGLQPSSAQTDARRVITLVVLFDELNARNAGPLVDELRDQGLVARSMAVPSIGVNTRNAVATMFHGEVFHDAQPCGFTSVCTESAAMDFSRVRASRADIDIAGFAHPYCAIQGLRSCARYQTPLAWFEWDRIRCSFWRRTTIGVGVSEDFCRAMYLDGFSRETASIIAAAMNAPALKSGGVLYVHVPLPHPPGTDVRGTLQSHYLANLVRARGLLHAMLEAAKASSLTPRVIVFSDHPLRQALWCSMFAPYVWDRCQPDAKLADTQVPIIVATKQAIDVPGLESNKDVFSLIATVSGEPQ